VNWEMIGALAELLGAVAVVISILYVSQQLRDSSASARRGANHELLDATNNAFVALAENAELAGLWGRGLYDFSSLNPIERIRFSAILLNIVYMWEESFHAAKAGLVDAFAFERTKGPRDELVALPGFRAWWAVRRDWVGDEFRAYMDGEMATGSFVSAMYEDQLSNAAPAAGTSRVSEKSEHESTPHE